MLRIGFDLSGGREGGTGRGTYTRSLISALAVTDRMNQYFFFGYPAMRGFLDRVNFRYRQYRELESIHVWHFPDLISPYLRDNAAAGPPHRCYGGTIRVVTVHDLLFEDFPGEFPAVTRQRFAAGFAAAMEAGAFFIVPSRWSAERLEERGVPRERLSVVTLAAGAHFAPCHDEESLAYLRRRHRISRPLILFVGGGYARKNLAAAVRSFTLLNARRRSELQMMVVGVTAGEARSLLSTALTDVTLAENDLLFPGIVPGGDMPLLYNAARVLLYPSMAEGFGLPVLEAMACGTPVITSMAPALMEVGGEAAVFVDPRDAEEMAAALARVSSDDGLRRELREQGLARAARFTWERTARETVEVYNRCLQASLV